MRPEDQLDQLIEQYENGENRSLFLDDETTSLVAAAERFTQLRKIDVPSDFARKLEGELRAKARAQKLSEQGQSGKLIPFAPTQGSTRPTRSLSHRTWAALIACIAVLLIACTSLLTISIHNSPGNSLSNRKQTATPTKIVSANSPQNRANATIQQLHNSIINLSTVVTDGQNDDAIQQALNTVSDWTSSSQEQVAGLPANSELPIIQQNLAQRIGEEEQTLHLLLKQVDWAMKVAFSRQSGVLGEPVPTVTSVTVHIQSSGVLLVTLTGTHFSPQAQLVVDGKPTGSVSQYTEKRLVAIINNAGRFSGTHTIGVLNPDGTAAQKIFKSSSDNTGSITPTPTPTSTPSSIPSPTPTHRPDE